ncbi:MAG: glutamate racemase [Sphingomonadales bacterium]|nr:glutamate racemase [Sphingomonadales bacterium]
MEQKPTPIGVFDSGYGGLTVLKELEKALPQYDYLYLGDNARAPYGTRSFDTVYEYTLQAVKWLFEQGCPLVILACNTASAKALRNIQQNDLPGLDPAKRVLGVIRPTAEIAGKLTKTGNIGILGTQGTVSSHSYILELQKFFPEVKVYQEACPMWVPLVENNEYNKPGADYFVKQNIDQLLAQCPDLDAVFLACTHYPLLLDKINKYIPDGTRVFEQGSIVAEGLVHYLERHPEMRSRLSTGSTRNFTTTDHAENFDKQATVFYGKSFSSHRIELL